MEAGRDLDALVARKIFNLDPIRVDGDMQVFTLQREWLEPGEYYTAETGGYNNRRLPHYSTDIAAAWQICEHLNDGRQSYAVWVRFNTLLRRSVLWGDTAAEAAHSICIAALQAHGISM